MYQRLHNALLRRRPRPPAHRCTSLRRRQGHRFGRSERPPSDEPMMRLRYRVILATRNRSFFLRTLVPTDADRQVRRRAAVDEAIFTPVRV